MGNLHDQTTARRAARYAANFARWRRKYGQPMLPIPGDLRPLPVSSVPALLPQPPSDQDEDPVRAVVRNCTAATLAANGLDQYARVMVRASEWEDFHEKRKSKSKDPGWCGFCELCKSCEGRVHKGQPNRALEKQNHEPVQIHFDSETLVSRAWVQGVKVQLDSEQLKQLAFAADPRNWKRAAPDFFRNSDPVRRGRNGQWEPDDAPWGKAGGFIYEVVHWTVNEYVDGEARNILRIYDFRNDFADGSLPADRAELSFKYALAETENVKLFAGWEPGGLDVDGGYYTLAAERSGAKAPWQVSISVEKRVRYIPVATSIPEVVTMTNFMAPALLQMLVGNLVNEGIERLKGPAHF
jgi:hypothetical protein